MATMRQVSKLLLMITAAIAAEMPDPWTKVREITSGDEVRIFKRDTKQPLLARFDEARDDSIVIVVKNEQIAVRKDQIDRIDARRTGGSRVKAETKTSTGGPEQRPDTPVPNRSPAPATSVSSGISVGSKPDFETVYRRPVLSK
jgi:hypothetical protein